MSYMACIEIGGSSSFGSNKCWATSRVLPSDNQDEAASRVERSLWLVRLLIRGALRLVDNAAVSRPAGGTYAVASLSRMPPISTLDGFSSFPETTCFRIAVGLVSSYSKAGESESAVVGGLLRRLLGGD
jgi:hypothetical protein